MKLWRREFGEKFRENEMAIINEISKDPKTTISQLRTYPKI